MSETRYELNLNEINTHYLRLFTEFILSSATITYLFFYNGTEARLNIFNLISIPSSLIILICVFEFLINPIIYSLIFALFYTLIMVLNWNLEKVIKMPLRAIKAIFKRFVQGFFEPLTSIGDITECQYGNYFYNPLLKITKYTDHKNYVLTFKGWKIEEM